MVGGGIQNNETEAPWLRNYFNIRINEESISRDIQDTYTNIIDNINYIIYLQDQRKFLHYDI